MCVPMGVILFQKDKYLFLKKFYIFRKSGSKASLLEILLC